MDPLAFFKTVSSVRAGLTPTASITAQTALLPNNINIGGSLSVAGEVTNNVTGALSLRAYDDTGLYAASTLTIGNPLPAPLTTKPILEQQVTSLNLAGATFGTVSSGYSLKINGYIQPPATGTYLFRTTYRDGASLVIATRKLFDSWIYAGTVQQSVGTITLYQNVWSQFAMEHTVAPSGSEKLLVEWCNPGGTYTTLQNGTFSFAYDMKEVPPSFLGTTYIYGKANFSDTAVMTAGASLPNATYFSGNTSELTNDAAFLKAGGTVTASALTVAGTGSLTNLIGGVGSLSTLAVGNIGSISTLTANLMASSIAAAFSARFYLSTAWSITSTGWQYLPNTFSIANDVPPNLNAIVASTSSTSSIVFNTSNSTVVVPQSGLYHFNIFGLGLPSSSSTGSELRLHTFSSPAWPAAGQAAKTYGVTAGSANSLAGSTQSILSTGVYSNATGENFCSWQGALCAGTAVVPLFFCLGTGTVGIAGIYIQVHMDHAFY